jgi:hypothetical protein
MFLDLLHNTSCSSGKHSASARTLTYGPSITTVRKRGPFERRPNDPGDEYCEGFILAGHTCLIGTLCGVQGWGLYPPMKHTDLIAMRQPVQTAALPM